MGYKDGNKIKQGPPKVSDMKKNESEPMVDSYELDMEDIYKLRPQQKDK